MRVCSVCDCELIGTAYGKDADGYYYCYVCCGTLDKKSMLSTGKYAGYLVKDENKYILTNWPGSLVFEVRGLKKSKHNIAKVRYDFWFDVFDPETKETHVWHGVSYGDNTEIAHCRKTKTRYTGGNS